MTSESGVSQQPSPAATWHRLELTEGDPSRTTLSMESLRALAQDSGGPLVTLTLPTHERGIEVRQDPIRLGSLLTTAEAELIRLGVDESSAQAMLEPARRLLEGQESFWSHGGLGLCLLLGPDRFHAFKLPYSVTERCEVGHRWDLQPLLELTRDDHFAIIAISRSSVRLYEGSRTHLEERPRGDMPARLEEVVGGEKEPASLQHHSSRAGDGPAVFHGHGKGHDDRDHELTQFVRSIAKALPDALSRPELPVVVAAVERTASEFRTRARGLTLVPETIEGDPDGAELRALHEAAWSSVEPLFDAPRTRALERLEAVPPRNMSNTVADAVREAFAGQVGTLLVAPDARVWGSYDPEADQLEQHEQRSPSSVDLVGLATTYTLQRGGTVYEVEPGALPKDTPAVALHRF